MTQPFPPLFSPLKPSPKSLKHRLTYGAHTVSMSVDGYSVDRHLGYYRERAIGGAAMIVVEPAPVHHSSVLTRGNFRCEDDSNIASIRRITDTVREHGAVIVQTVGGCAPPRHARAAIHEGRRLGPALREPGGSCAWSALPNQRARA